MEEKFTKGQELLKKLRDDRCGGNAAQLARLIGKDASYVNRLLYPIGKAGRKGIGLEVMRAATAAFKLPADAWDGANDPAEQGYLLPATEDHMEDKNAAKQAVDEAIAMLAHVLQQMDDDGRDYASLALGKFAKNPTGEKDRVTNILAASIQDAPQPPPAPRPTKTAKAEPKSKAAATRPSERAGLVLKIGGGQKQMFSVPIQPLRKAIDNRNATPREREWHEVVKAAPKAKSKAK